MSFSYETQQKINQFAKDQSQYYLENDEMTYIEKLRKKSNQTKNKIGAKMARFKASSDQGQEAQNDMILYMSDYISDLISQGFSESEAFEKASKELSAAGEFEQSEGFQARFKQHDQKRSPADEELIGLFYGGFLFLGVAIGGLIGLLSSGGHPAFSSGGWVDTVIGACIGAVIGMGLGQISNAIIVAMRRK